MSKLDELIKEYCPDGVEYISLKNISEIGTGSSDRKEAVENGEYPFYVRSRDVLRINKFEFDETAIVIPGEGGIGDIFHYVEGKYALHQRAYRVHIIDNCLNPRFLYYYMFAKFKGFILSKAVSSTVSSIRKPMIEEFKVAVPPLEVQREIVRVLDKFTLLTAELTAELTARKKQYEYYRNDLLSFETKTERISLGDLFDFRNGLSKGKDFFGRGIPFIRYTDVYNNRYLRKDDITALVECTKDEIQKLNVKRGDVLFTRTSETAEDVGWSSVVLDDLDECVFNGFTIKATPKTDKLLPEYCSFCFSTDEFRKYVTKNCAFTTRASLTGETLSKYKLAVPSIEVQKKIADVLYNFEEICSNLNIGLPAEIEARQKQYEFYRDQLLTFVEKGETILTDRQTDRQSLIKLMQYVFGYIEMNISDIADISRGVRVVKKQLSSEGKNPVFQNCLSPMGYYEKYNREGNEAYIISAGAAGDVGYCENEFWAADDCFVFDNLIMVDNKYLFYWLVNNSDYLKRNVRKASIPRLSKTAIENMKIKIPSHIRQKEIIAILDKLYKLCNDISDGIPSEIEARQKQYEYYRDKLLTFKEKEV